MRSSTAAVRRHRRRDSWLALAAVTTMAILAGTVGQAAPVSAAPPGAAAAAEAGDPPSAPVTGLRVTSEYDAESDDFTVAVGWDVLDPDDWNGSPGSYHVTIDPPEGVEADPAWCAADIPDPGQSCTFKTSESGLYTAHVVATNDAGDGPPADKSVYVDPKTPDAAIDGLTLIPHAGPGVVAVQVDWNPLPDENWRGQQHRYHVRITPDGDGAVVQDDCRPLAEDDSAPAGCNFVVNASDTYTVTVTAVNEVGAGPESEQQSIPVTVGAAGAPSERVEGLTATAEAGSGVVDVSWNPLGEEGWNGSEFRGYIVSVTTPDQQQLADEGSCEPIIMSPRTTCSFTVDTGGDYGLQILAINDSGASNLPSFAGVHLTLAPPTGPVGPVTVTNSPGSAHVELSWDRMTDGWSGAREKSYEVTITGAGDLEDNTCGSVPDNFAPSCSFTAGSPGPFTAVVRAVNEVGPAAEGTTAKGRTSLTPTASVSGVTMEADPDTGTIYVHWNRLDEDDWLGAETHAYQVGEAGPPGAEIYDDTCQMGDIPDSDEPGCHFRATLSGEYSVSVVPVTEAGVSSGPRAMGDVQLELPPGPPLAAVFDLDVRTTPGDNTVEVTWDAVPTDSAAWNGAVDTHDYVVTIMGPKDADIDPGTCTTLTAASCRFSTDRGGNYNVHVALRNDFGTSERYAYAGNHVTLRPTAVITGIRVDGEPGSSEVKVGWDRLADADWNGGSEHEYMFAIGSPPGARIELGTCTTVEDAPNPHCGFTADTPGEYTVQVMPVNEIGAAPEPGIATGTLPAGAPAAATAVSGVAGTNTITASWTPAVGTRLAGVSSYTVSAVADGYPARTCPGTVTDSPCTVIGVAAGVAYTVRVVTNGPGGTSQPADSSDPVVPEGAPKAPVEVPGNAVPAGSGSARPGAPVTIRGSGYKPFSIVVLSLFSDPLSLGTATADANGDISATVYLPEGAPTGNHTLLATGLDPSGAVLNLAKAVAVAAAPPVIIPPNTTTPPTITPPTTTPPATTGTPPSGAVGALAARPVTAGRRDVTVTWNSGGVSWGDGEARGYEVSVTGPSGARITGSCTGAVTGSAGSCGFSTDLDGTYAVRVAAATTAGRSARSASVNVTVAVAPSVPTAVTGTPGANAITVSWKPPASAGAGIRGYRVTATAPYYRVRGCDPVKRSPCTITGLASGVRYVARVVAIGAGGDSPAATSDGAIIPSGNVYVPSAVPVNAASNGVRVARAGAGVTVGGTGFRPGSRVRVTLYPGSRSLGVATASAKGAVSMTVTMPANCSCTALATGLDPDGRIRNVATILRGRTSIAGVRDVPTSVKDTASRSSPSALAITGSGSGPVLLAGFLLIVTGLLLANSSRPQLEWGRRRTRDVRLAARSVFRSKHQVD
jgi:hypothetical protein